MKTTHFYPLRLTNSFLNSGGYAKWDGGITVKLLIKFLKKHNCVHNLYSYLYEDSISHNGWDFMSGAYPGLYEIPVLFLRYGKDKTKLKYSVPCKRDLALSQLWRFTILENLGKYPTHKQKELEKIVKEKIYQNGYRDSEEIRNLMEKYGIRTRKRWYVKST